MACDGDEVTCKTRSLTSTAFFAPSAPRGCRFLENALTDEMVRTTPRRDRKAPTRLGLDDGWADGTNNWMGSPIDKAKEEKKAKARAKAVKAMNDEMDGTIFDKYASLREDNPAITAMIEGGVLSACGDWFATTQIKGGDWDQERTAKFALWGALVTLIVAPFQSWIRKKKYAKPKGGAMDCAYKGIVGQARGPAPARSPNRAR